MSRVDRFSSGGALALLVASLLLSGCGASTSSSPSAETGGGGGGGSAASGAPGVGEACIPSDEQRATFNGFQTSETNLDVRNPGCRGDGAVCVVVGFQGRVSCPYGQTNEDLTLPDNDPRRCHVVDSAGVPSTGAVTVSVPPQLVDRQPKDAVFCSCRCTGPDAAASYCTCPSGATCIELVPSLGLSLPGPNAGSYCVPAGIELKGDASGPTCSPDDASCGATR